jgi:Tol biopolymer transport system component
MDDRDSSREEELDRILAEFIAARDESRTLDQDEWIQRYPSFAEELRKFFGNREALLRLIAPVDGESPIIGVNPVRFEAGTQLGRYEIVGLIGVGGMGEVYRAKDSELKRDVAIKVLPDAFSRDAERVARLEREARVLASLNHGQIGLIWDVGQFGESRFLVLEFVEGETLADRIHRGPVPIDDALHAAAQIAEAVSAAHEKGIVHRDLKPANIKIAPDGNLKVLDFGLAKALDLENTPSTLSEPGRILGTAAYMSPEQARGQDADRRSDVWAFGCLLYEMLTGQAAFTGETVNDILAEVLRAEPDWDRLPAETPPGIRRLLRRCLQKNRRHRLHDIADARLDIEDAPNEPAAGVAPSGRERFAWITALGFTIVAVGLAVWIAVQPAPSLWVLDIATEPTNDPLSFSVSNDGKIAYVATYGEGDRRESRLFVRRPGNAKAKPLPSAVGAMFPFWSADGRYIAYFAGGKLWKIDVETELQQSLADIPGVFRGGTWAGDRILVGTAKGPILRVPASGGDPEAVTRLDGPGSHRFPQLFPDGEHFIYYAAGDDETGGVYLARLGSNDAPELLLKRRETQVAGVYEASTQRLLFVTDGNWYSQRLDLRQRRLIGKRTLVVPEAEVAEDGLSYALAVSASGSGFIVYRAGFPCGSRQFTWVDETGNETGAVGGPFGPRSQQHCPLNPSLSPDGQRLTYSVMDAKGNVDIWERDAGGRQPARRLTRDPASDMYSVYSPGGSAMAIASNREGGLLDIYKIDLPKLDISAPDANLKPMLPDGKGQVRSPLDWCRERASGDEFLVFRILTPDGWDLAAWRLDRNGQALGESIPLADSLDEERDGQCSPDGKWVAYQSDALGSTEIWIVSVQGPERAPVKISNGGGAQVRWIGDNRLTYIRPDDGELMELTLEFGPEGPRPTGARPLLFSYIGGAFHATYRQQYAADPARKRFLVNKVLDEAPDPIRLIRNWRPERD